MHSAKTLGQGPLTRAAETRTADNESRRVFPRGGGGGATRPRNPQKRHGSAPGPRSARMLGLCAEQLPEHHQDAVRPGPAQSCHPDRPGAPKNRSPSSRKSPYPLSGRGGTCSTDGHHCRTPAHSSLRAVPVAQRPVRNRSLRCGQPNPSRAPGEPPSRPKCGGGSSPAGCTDGSGDSASRWPQSWQSAPGWPRCSPENTLTPRPPQQCG